MKRRNKGMLVGISVMLMLLMLFPGTASANSTEPPGFVILVSGAPQGMTISMERIGDGKDEPILLLERRQGWESYYRYYYYMEPYDGPYMERSLEGIELHVKGAGHDFRLELPTEAFRSYDNLLTLDLTSQKLEVGQPIWRVPLLVSLRVISTLLIEGAVFWLFGYRKKRSWIVFFAVNLFTQGGLNLALTNPVPGGSSYWQFALVILEVLILLVEIVLYRGLLTEKSKWKAAGLAVASNLSSLFLGAMLLTYLPW